MLRKLNISDFWNSRTVLPLWMWLKLKNQPVECGARGFPGGEAKEQEERSSCFYHDAAVWQPQLHYGRLSQLPHQFPHPANPSASLRRSPCSASCRQTPPIRSTGSEWYWPVTEARWWSSVSRRLSPPASSCSSWPEPRSSRSETRLRTAHSSTAHRNVCWWFVRRMKMLLCDGFGDKHKLTNMVFDLGNYNESSLFSKYRDNATVGSTWSI